MSGTGIGSRVVATISAQVLRVVGLLTVSLSVVVIALSLSTEHGLAVRGGDAQTAAYVTDVGVVTALAEFAGAHPAYPVAMLVGIVLIVADDETPLLGS
ncbi:hypothetical protein [Halosimplex sp. J119]